MLHVQLLARVFVRLDALAGTDRHSQPEGVVMAALHNAAVFVCRYHVAAQMILDVKVVISALIIAVFRQNSFQRAVFVNLISDIIRCF
jgi:hypothetical protein